MKEGREGNWTQGRDEEEKEGKGRTLYKIKGERKGVQ